MSDNAVEPLNGVMQHLDIFLKPKNVTNGGGLANTTLESFELEDFSFKFFMTQVVEGLDTIPFTAWSAIPSPFNPLLSYREDPKNGKFFQNRYLIAAFKYLF